MQATIDAVALKPFTRALTCLSKYGDDLSIYATPETFSLSATNSSKSAYCRFKYNYNFFTKYNVGNNRDRQQDDFAEEVHQVLTVTGQLLTKSLLSILKHRTVEKSVEKCVLSIIEGAPPSQGDRSDEETDSLESRLVIRLHCKHGIVKTHRLLLLSQPSLLAPGLQDSEFQSRLTIGPRAIKDIVEHFPSAKSGKSDPQLVWTFHDSEVQLKSLENIVDARGRAQLSTELTISAAEFDVYDVKLLPTTIAFHLREFNATIAYAESMSLALDLSFTDPNYPLRIDVEDDNSETLFVISTSHAYGNSGGGNGASANGSQNRDRSTPPSGQSKKRAREEDSRPSTSSGVLERKRPMKAVQSVDAAALANSMRAPPRPEPQRRSPLSMPPPSLPPPQSAHPRPPLFTQRPGVLDNGPEDPLFLPASQLSLADQEVLRETGLGIEKMTAAELDALFDDSADPDLDFEFGSPGAGGEQQGDWDMADGGKAVDGFELVDELEVFEATQGDQDGDKTFRPLFED